MSLDESEFDTYINAQTDDEIEDILIETEDANCNVAQGYNVFKKLKLKLNEFSGAKTQEEILLEKTKYGSDGIGGIITKGTMHVGYPR